MKPNVVLQKEKAGEFLNAGELIVALNNNLFSDDSIICIHSLSCQERLSAVINCGGCNCLHLIGGQLDSKQKAGFSFSDRVEVFINRLTCDDVVNVKRKDLIPVLEKLDRDTIITLESVQDEGHHMPLVSVFKCPNKDCKSIHLAVGFFSDEPDFHSN